MPRRGKLVGGREFTRGSRNRKMGGLHAALVNGGSQVSNPEGSNRGPKDLVRTSKGAMRNKMKG